MGIPKGAFGKINCPELGEKSLYPFTKWEFSKTAESHKFLIGTSLWVKVCPKGRKGTFLSWRRSKKHQNLTWVPLVLPPNRPTFA